jgi:hypothetical protein
LQEEEQEEIFREGKKRAMGCRSCDKPKMNYRKGLWSPEEDQRLRDYIVKHGLGCWSAVPAKAGELFASLCLYCECTLLHSPMHPSSQL